MAANSPSGSHNKSAGIISGIVVSVVFFLLILIVVVLLLLRRKRNQHFGATETVHQVQEGTTSEELAIHMRQNGSRSSLEILSRSRAPGTISTSRLRSDRPQAMMINGNAPQHPMSTNTSRDNRPDPKEETGRRATSSPGPSARRNMGDTTGSSRRLIIDLAAFPVLFERLTRLMLSESPLGYVDQEPPPRYEE